MHFKGQSKNLVHLDSVRYFYGPAKPVSSKDNSNGHRAAISSKSHPLYNRRISAPGNDTPLDFIEVIQLNNQ